MSATGIVAGTLYAFVASLVYVAFETPAKGAKQTDSQAAWGDLPAWVSKIVFATASLVWPITLSAGWLVLRSRGKKIETMLVTLRELDAFVDDVLIAESKRLGDSLGWLNLRVTLRDQARSYIAASTDDDKAAIAKARRHLAYYQAFIWFQCTCLFILLGSKGENFDTKKLPPCFAHHEREIP